MSKRAEVHKRRLVVALSTLVFLWLAYFVATAAWPVRTETELTESHGPGKSLAKSTESEPYRDADLRPQVQGPKHGKDTNDEQEIPLLQERGDALIFFNQDLSLNKNMQSLLNLNETQVKEFTHMLENSLTQLKNLEAKNCEIVDGAEGKSFRVGEFYEVGKKIISDFKQQISKLVGNQRGEYITTCLEKTAAFNDWGGDTTDYFFVQEGANAYFCGNVVASRVGRPRNLPVNFKTLLTPTTLTQLKGRFPYMFDGRN